MTRERKAEFLQNVRDAGSGRLRWERRAFLLIGAIQALTVPVCSAGAMEGQPDWFDEISPAGSVIVTATGVPWPEANELLEGFGLAVGSVPDPEVQVYASDAFHGVHEAKADWAAKRLELNGKFALRQSTEVLGQAMTVTSVIGSDGLLVTDDRGGSRVEAYREFPLATCYRGNHGDCDGASFDAAWDVYGSIVEFIRDDDGLPGGVRFGETLLLRYGFTPPLPGPPSRARSDRWREPSSWDLIDLRTSEIVIDSVDAAKVASERPTLSVGFKAAGELLRFKDGKPFAVAQGRYGWPYAFLSLETASEIWRRVYASGDMSRAYKFRVDYTDELVRVEIKAREYGQSIVVEAPRSPDSAIPVSFVHPGADMLTDAMRSGARQRTAEPLGAWLESSFDRESLPIVLTPFHGRGIEMESGIVRATGASEEPHFEFGPAQGCEENDQGILCSGGDSDVIGQESPYR